MPVTATRLRKKRKQSQEFNLFKSQKFWIVSLALVVVLTLLTVGYQYTSRAVQNGTERFAAWLAREGFAIKNVMVDGRQYANANDVKKLLAVEKNDPILYFSTQKAAENLAQIPWVESATVERRFPDTIKVTLHEYEPAALWEHKDAHGKISIGVIAENGKILTRNMQPAFRELLMVTGDKAPEKMGVIFEALDENTELKEYIRAASYVAERRWDLTLKNGVTVKLPEVNEEGALKRLASAHKKSKLLDRAVETIDLRQDDRIIVKIKPGVMEELKNNGKPQDTPA
ncbi:MAG: FtsQ-type POTRA domain-containing protein [Alphaproteobacteria bacterium]|nr:FtsQ-type POTRA domain-containing protein [Alphaproteobacteria bacterium]